MKLSPCGAGPPASSRCPRRAGPRPTAAPSLPRAWVPTLAPPTRPRPRVPPHASDPPALPGSRYHAALPPAALACRSRIFSGLHRQALYAPDGHIRGAPTATAAGQPLTLRRVPREAPSQLRSSPPRTTLVTSPSMDDGRSMKGCAIRRGAGAGLSPQTQPQRNGL